MSQNPYSNFPLTIPISFGIKEIDALYWMRSFTVDTLMKRYRLNKPYSVLYLQKTVAYRDMQAMDPSSKKALSFAVNEYNLDDVKDFFGEIYTWFLPDNVSQLYGENDDGLLVFNMDFKDLCAKVVDEYGMIKTALKCVPTTVEYAHEKYERGVVFFINRHANGVVLRQRQIVRMCKFFEKFDFMAWDQYAMGCFAYAAQLGRILSYEELKQQMDANRQYNSNFNGF